MTESASEGVSFLSERNGRSSPREGKSEDVKERIPRGTSEPPSFPLNTLAHDAKQDSKSNRFFERGSFETTTPEERADEPIQEDIQASTPDPSIATGPLEKSMKRENSTRLISYSTLPSLEEKEDPNRENNLHFLVDIIQSPQRGAEELPNDRGEVESTQCAKSPLKEQNPLEEGQTNAPYHDASLQPMPSSSNSASDPSPMVSSQFSSSSAQTGTKVRVDWWKNTVILGVRHTIDFFLTQVSVLHFLAPHFHSLIQHIEPFPFLHGKQSRRGNVPPFSLPDWKWAVVYFGHEEQARQCSLFHNSIYRPFFFVDSSQRRQYDVIVCHATLSGYNASFFTGFTSGNEESTAKINATDSPSARTPSLGSYIPPRPLITETAHGWVLLSTLDVFPTRCVREYVARKSRCGKGIFLRPCKRFDEEEKQECFLGSECRYIHLRPEAMEKVFGIASVYDSFRVLKSEEELGISTWDFCRRSDTLCIRHLSKEITPSDVEYMFQECEGYLRSLFFTGTFTSSALVRFSNVEGASQALLQTLGSGLNISFYAVVEDVRALLIQEARKHVYELRPLPRLPDDPLLEATENQNQLNTRKPYKRASLPPFAPSQKRMRPLMTGGHFPRGTEFQYTKNVQASPHPPSDQNPENKPHHDDPRSSTASPVDNARFFPLSLTPLRSGEKGARTTPSAFEIATEEKKKSSNQTLQENTEAPKKDEGPNVILRPEASTHWRSQKPVEYDRVSSKVTEIIAKIKRSGPPEKQNYPLSYNSFPQSRAKSPEGIEKGFFSKHLHSTFKRKGKVWTSWRGSKESVDLPYSSYDEGAATRSSPLTTRSNYHRMSRDQSSGRQSSNPPSDLGRSVPSTHSATSRERRPESTPRRSSHPESRSKEHRSCSEKTKENSKIPSRERSTPRTAAPLFPFLPKGWDYRINSRGNRYYFFRVGVEGQTTWLHPGNNKGYRVHRKHS